MIDVNTAFIFFSALVFFGFILNALFAKVKIANILPLMLIGLLLGPVLHVVSTSPNSVIARLTPFITATAIAFILFRVGLSIDFNSLKRVLSRATLFTFTVTAVSGIILGAIALYIFGWNIEESFIFGFALAGPSTLILPIIVSLTKINEDLKTTLIYEAVTSDVLTLIVPLVLFEILITPNVGVGFVTVLVFNTIFGSVFAAAISAFLWLYILNRFKTYSKGYGWMLTIAMVVATYGLTQSIGFNGAMTVFVFGLLVANIGSRKTEVDAKHNVGIMEKYFAVPDIIADIKDYQNQIVFFVSTFFFVYLGMLFTVSGASIALVVFAVLISVLILPIRYLFIPMIKDMFSKDRRAMKIEHSFVAFDISRGLAPAVIATLPIAYGILIPHFTDSIFLVMLITNIIATVGVFATYREVKGSSLVVTASDNSKV
jgi:NhaP-type Na+/H+ or K+/H+ antiporter